MLRVGQKIFSLIFYVRLATKKIVHDFDIGDPEIVDNLLHKLEEAIRQWRMEVYSLWNELSVKQKGMEAPG